MTEKGQIGIYVHWPFCLAKCPYCDFNSHVREGVDHDLWRRSFLQSLDYYAPHMAGREIVSVFFGGGTPSLMAPSTVEAILGKIAATGRLVHDAEVTLEANPTSVEADKFKAFRVAGVNRVSLGIQALNDNDLKFLGRQHSAQEALSALEIAKDNFSRVSFDLIYARPGQNLKDWEDELARAMGYADGHLSLYQLTIERGTPFFLEHARGAFTMPANDLAADFYEMTQETLSARGLPSYEVSNHAREGQESRHNLIYWRYQDYIGIGPGAHGRLGIDGKKYAVREHNAPEIWLKKVSEEGTGAHPFASLSRRDRFLEALMMGLRLREGVSPETLDREAGCDWREMVNRENLAALEKEGMLKITPSRLILTQAGMMRLNSILSYLLPAAV